MATIHEGVNCESCARQGMINYCKPCSSRLGHQHWVAAEGVKTEKRQQIRFGRGKQVFYDTVVTIKNKELAL